MLDFFFYYSLVIHLGAMMKIRDIIIKADYHLTLDIHDEKFMEV